MWLRTRWRSLSWDSTRAHAWQQSPRCCHGPSTRCWRCPEHHLCTQRAGRFVPRYSHCTWAARGVVRQGPAPRAHPSHGGSLPSSAYKAPAEPGKPHGTLTAHATLPCVPLVCPPAHRAVGLAIEFNNVRCTGNCECVWSQAMPVFAYGEKMPVADRRCFCEQICSSCK